MTNDIRRFGGLAVQPHTGGSGRSNRIARDIGDWQFHALGRIPVAAFIQRKQKTIEPNAQANEPSRTRRRVGRDCARISEAFAPVGDKIIVSSGHGALSTKTISSSLRYLLGLF